MRGFLSHCFFVHASLCFASFPSKQKCENSFAGLGRTDNSRQKLPDGSATFCFSAGQIKGFQPFPRPKQALLIYIKVWGRASGFFKKTKNFSKNFKAPERLNFRSLKGTHRSNYPNSHKNDTSVLLSRLCRVYIRFRHLRDHSIYQDHNFLYYN